jgi:NAD(P)-dependent dehydrogenase (short-subunit alcohol dehydrogenase family)
MTVLDGKVAVVTGASSGIGAATMALLARSGATVVNWDVTPPSGHTQTFMRVDVTDANAVNNAAAEVEGKFGGIDILVNVAGNGSQQTVESMTPENWNDVLALNLSAHFFTLKACVPAMRKRGGGRIVTVSSLAAQRMSMNLGISYTASKSGLLGLVRHAAFEFARDNILVNAVLPGPVMTPLMKGKSTQDAIDFATQSIPIGRFLEADEVAEAILFFCSPASSGCTGSSLLVDGGCSIGVVSPAIYFKGRS